jgi:hypothetical protein
MVKSDHLGRSGRLIGRNGGPGWLVGLTAIGTASVGLPIYEVVPLVRTVGDLHLRRWIACAMEADVSGVGQSFLAKVDEILLQQL